MSSIWNGLQDLLGGTLTFFYGLIPNFGVAIILLTIAIGLVLFPLTLKQTRSMKAMQEIQPEIKRIQREFKTDRPAQQQAMMELYRERGVNPAAGCLPLLLQMPVWFALFSVLRSFGAAELAERLKWVTSGSALESAIQAGKELTFLWMNLSVSPNEALSGSETFDGGFLVSLPYLITIGLVIVTAWWQQKQTMAKQQPGQQPVPGQAVMKIFPFFFGFISFNLPAGLVVYFAASQIFRIGQQALILGLDEKRKAAAPAVKKQGGSSPTPRPQATPGANGQEATSPASRRPQGSKKKRGKKRRRS